MKTLRWAWIWQAEDRSCEAKGAAGRTLRFLFSTTLIIFFAGIRLVWALGNNCLLPSAYCALQKGQEARPAGARAPSKLPAPTLDINLASAEDFQKLPGIGPKLAEQIVAFRRKHGPFRRVEDLMAIKGVGIKKWKAIRPYLRVGKQERPQG